MSKNKIRLFFKTPSGKEHSFINLVQMRSEKSVYFITLHETCKSHVGYIDKDNNLKIVNTCSASDRPKISVHTSGQVHVKNKDDKIIIKFKIPPIEKLNYPQEICTIFPTNPFSYPPRIGSNELDTEIDLSWIEKGKFGLKICLIKPCELERKINEILLPVDSRYPMETEMRVTYKEYREFGFFITYYQTPLLTRNDYAEDELWIFNKPEDSEKQIQPVIFDGNIIEKDGKKIVISEPKLELKKIK